LSEIFEDKLSIFIIVILNNPNSFNNILRSYKNANIFEIEIKSARLNNIFYFISNNQIFKTQKLLIYYKVNSKIIY
jgi:hypothetical protein